MHGEVSWPCNIGDGRGNQNWSEGPPPISRPLAIFIISQYVALPLVWRFHYYYGYPCTPYFLWERGTTTGFTQTHVNFTDAAGLFFLLVSMAFFIWIHTQTYAWTWTASFLGGPFFPIPPYVAALFLPSSNSSDPAGTSSKFIVSAYHAAALTSFLLWVCAIFTLIRTYQDAESILGALLVDQHQLFCANQKSRLVRLVPFHGSCAS